MSEQAFLEPTNQPECDGSTYCRAPVHIHGCFADKGDCDEPREHCAACSGDPEAHGLHVCGREPWS